MELISTQRMTYEAWLHTWNLDDDDENENENDDEYSSSEEAGEGGGGEQQRRQRKERRASRNDLKRVSRREVSLEDSEGKQCAICLAVFFEEEEEDATTTTTTVAGKDESKCRFVAELPCKHVYHEECIKSWLSRSRRCPTCRKSLREKRRGEAAKNGSEEGLLLRPREIRTARATRRGEAAEREDGRALREVDAVERERRAREEEEENRARRMEALLTHEGMNDEIFESVIDHATRLLEAAAVTREEDEDTEGGREQEEEEEEEEEEESNMSRARVANQTGAGSLLVGTRGWSSYGSNTL